MIDRHGSDMHPELYELVTRPGGYPVRKAIELLVRFHPEALEAAGWRRPC